MNNYPYQNQKGFTLIEIIVSVSIFVVVMLIAVGAVLNAVDANRKAQSLNVIINNLNLTFESMVRDLRTGKNYSTSCGSNCIQFMDKEGRSVTYTHGSSDGALYINRDGFTGRISGDEVVLEYVNFTVRGLGSRDGPERILIQIKGSAGTGRTESKFNVETLVTSRILDIEELNL
jgi:prepilin-type N-terminal cleavage/methylation domain-containing protein